MEISAGSAGISWSSPSGPCGGWQNAVSWGWVMEGRVAWRPRRVLLGWPPAQGPLLLLENLLGFEAPSSGRTPSLVRTHLISPEWSPADELQVSSCGTSFTPAKTLPLQGITDAEFPVSPALTGKRPGSACAPGAGNL